MAVDVGALRKFQDTWGPVLEAIPAVIEAVAKQDDFVRLEAEQQKLLDKAKQEIAGAYAQADKRLEAVNAELDALAKQKLSMQTAIESQRAEADAAAKVAQADAKTKLDTLNKQIDATAARLSNLGADYAAKLADARAAHEAAVQSMQSEIRGLEQRKYQAQQALDALRAKLG